MMRNEKDCGKKKLANNAPKFVFCYAAMNVKSMKNVIFTTEIKPSPASDEAKNQVTIKQELKR